MKNPIEVLCDFKGITIEQLSIRAGVDAIKFSSLSLYNVDRFTESDVIRIGYIFNMTAIELKRLFNVTQNCSLTALRAISDSYHKHKTAAAVQTSVENEMPGNSKPC